MLYACDTSVRSLPAMLARVRAKNASLAEENARLTAESKGVRDLREVRGGAVGGAGKQGLLRFQAQHCPHSSGVQPENSLATKD